MDFFNVLNIICNNNDRTFVPPVPKNFTAYKNERTETKDFITRGEKPENDSFIQCLKDKIAHPKKKYSFQINQIDCIIESVNKFNWVGKIKIPNEHPHHGAPTIIISKFYHGAVSFNGTHIGFGTSSVNDYCLSREIMTGQSENNKPYINFDYVVTQLKKFVVQIQKYQTIAIEQKLQKRRNELQSLMNKKYDDKKIPRQSIIEPIFKSMPASSNLDSNFDLCSFCMQNTFDNLFRLPCNPHNGHTNASSPDTLLKRIPPMISKKNHPLNIGKKSLNIGKNPLNIEKQQKKLLDNLYEPLVPNHILNKKEKPVTLSSGRKQTNDNRKQSNNNNEKPVIPNFTLDREENLTTRKQSNNNNNEKQSNDNWVETDDFPKEFEQILENLKKGGATDFNVYKMKDLSEQYEINKEKSKSNIDPPKKSNNENKTNIFAEIQKMIKEIIDVDSDNDSDSDYDDMPSLEEDTSNNTDNKNPSHNIQDMTTIKKRFLDSRNKNPSHDIRDRIPREQRICTDNCFEETGRLSNNNNNNNTIPNPKDNKPISDVPELPKEIEDDWFDILPLGCTKPFEKTNLIHPKIHIDLPAKKDETYPKKYVYPFLTNNNDEKSNLKKDTLTSNDDNDDDNNYNDMPSLEENDTSTSDDDNDYNNMPSIEENDTSTSDDENNSSFENILEKIPVCNRPDYNIPDPHVLSIEDNELVVDEIPINDSNIPMNDGGIPINNNHDIPINNNHDIPINNNHDIPINNRFR